MYMKVKIVCEKDKYEKLKIELEAKGIEVVEESNLVLMDLESHNNRIRIQTKTDIEIVNALDIVAIESFDHDIFVYVKDKELVTRTPLREMKKMLDDSFIQINQSVIINKKCIKKIKNAFNYRFIVFMSNGKEFTVTKTYYYKFIEDLNL